MHAERNHTSNAPLVLRLDAATCLVMGLGLILFGSTFSPLLGLPASLLFWAGILLFPSAALMWLAARSNSWPLVWTVVIGNVAWVAASLLVLVAVPGITALGIAFVAAQAVAVGLFAVVEAKVVSPGATARAA